MFATIRYVDNYDIICKRKTAVAVFVILKRLFCNFAKYMKVKWLR